MRRGLSGGAVARLPIRAVVWLLVRAVAQLPIPAFDLWEDLLVLAPPSEFGRCPCGGHLALRAAEVRVEADDQTIVLQDVAQGVCERCGSRVYKAGVIADLDTLMGGWPVLEPSPAR